MENNQSNSPNQHKAQDKNSNHTTQLKTISAYLYTHDATASMVSNATGVPQKCICRYKRDLEKSGRLKELHKSLCKVTGFKAWYLTTDPAKFLTDNQTKLF